MTLQELGNVGEFVGSIAVLISLIYLGVQIRKSTEAARTTTYQSIVSDFGAMNQVMASAPDLSYLYVTAMEDFDGLAPDEKARISQLFYMTFRYFENMFYQHEKGYLEDGVWAGWERLMVTYFNRRGFQTWWALRRDVFSGSFVRFLETAENREPVPSYHEVVRATASGSAGEV